MATLIKPAPATVDDVFARLRLAQRIAALEVRAAQEHDVSNEARDSGGRWSSSITKEDVANILEKQYHNKGKSKNSLSEKWLVSKVYHLRRVPVLIANSPWPVAPGEISHSDGPIVIEKNISEAGRFEGSYGAPPDHIIVDGKHRFQQALDRGDTHIDAYVGEEVLPLVEQETLQHEIKTREMAEAEAAYRTTPNGSTLRRFQLSAPPHYVDRVRQEVRSTVRGKDVSQEPRDHAGRWTALNRQGDRWVAPPGDSVPEHTGRLGIPPGWKDVRVATDPNADLQAIGTDAKGRSVRIYSDEFVKRQAEAKFARNQELLRKQHAVFAQNQANLNSPDAGTREAAACMSLIMATGLRPGSDRDTKAEKQAYGATTLQGQHVTVDEHGQVVLRFTGKKGVDLNIPVSDPAVARMLLARKSASGDNGKLFDTTDADLRAYTHTLDGGGFKPKDFRTLKGTMEAQLALGHAPARAATMKEYKKRVMAVAKHVSEKLGNTPTIALQSYINPFVFEAIQPIV